MTLLFALVVLMQVGNPILQPPAPAPNSNTTTTNNVTNVFPAPDPSVVIETEKQAAPVILDSGLRSIDTDAGGSLGQVFDVGLGFAQIRKDLILLPVVTEINHNLQRVVLSALALVVAALALWGILGQFVGSDGQEAFEALARVPLWCMLALTSLQWFGLVLDFFAALGGVIASSAHGAFGPTLRPDFWSDVGLGLFALFVGLFYLVNLFLFALQLFANTAFLGFCGLSAPVFVFLGATPWTSRWAHNWFHMVPATAGDMLAMLSILVVGAAGLDHITIKSAFLTIAFDLGLLFSLPLIRRLFGLEGNSVGSRLFGAVAIARLLRNVRAGNGGSAAAAATSSAGATSPTRAPRFSAPRGTAATGKAF